MKDININFKKLFESLLVTLLFSIVSFLFILLLFSFPLVVITIILICFIIGVTIGIYKEI